MPKALYYVLTVCERSDTYGHSDTPPLKENADRHYTMY